MYDELFLVTLNRHPTREEVAKLNEVRSGNANVKLGTPTPVTTPPKKGNNPPPKTTGGGAVRVPGAAEVGGEVGFYQDVFWALLNTSEFMINH
jgi:hypothetical protein